MPVDFAIVGQGLAGACMAYSLTTRGASVRVYDNPAGHKASDRAAGVINPITGRRFVKTWMADTILPLAMEYYTRLEKSSGLKILRPVDIYHALDDAFMEDNWLLRKGDQDYERFMEGLVNQPYSHLKSETYGHIKGGLQVRISNVLEAVRGALAEHNIEFEASEVTPDSTFESLQASNIIYCEGIEVRLNPWFNWLPNMVAKGEALICRIPDLGSKEIIKHGLSIVPLWEDDLYWIGSTYEWENYDPTPSKEGKEYLLFRLKKAVDCEFEIIDHIAGLRPTAKDRRPFVGRHPEVDNLYLLNGLGTKGASLAPYCAESLADHILNGTEIPAAMHLNRYFEKGQL